MVTDEALYERLSAVTGLVLDQPELLAEWSRDWWPPGAKAGFDERDLPAFAVLPESVAEVVDVVRLAGEAGRAIIIKGGGSNTVGAIAPVAGAIIVDVRALNVIDAVDPVNMTVQVDAGVFGGELETRLNELGYTLDFDPESLHISTVGGWIATRASGISSTDGRGIEDLVEAVDLVLADGTVARLSKRPGGPDLVIGAEGAFGIVTAATLRVRPLPEEQRFRALAMPSYEGALDAIRRVLQAGLFPAVVRLHDRAESARLASKTAGGDGEHLLVLVFEGDAAKVDLEERLTLQAFRAAGGRDLGAEPAMAWYDRRHRMDWFIDGNEEVGWIADAVDVSASWSALPAVTAAGREAFAAHADEVWVHSARFSPSGGEVSFVCFIRDAADDRALDRHRRAFDAGVRAAIDAGGSISPRGGIGRARRPWLGETSAADFETMRRIKKALDPERRLASGWLGLP